jgi:DNA-binding MurR/RpiR family transcriptional regulator
MSPLARFADFVLEVATDGTGHSLSPTAVFSLLNVFVAALSFRLPEQVMEALRRVDIMYRTQYLLFRE